MLHRCHRRVGARRGHAKVRWWLLDAVAVAGPDDRRRLRLKPGEQACVLANRDLCAAVFMLARRNDLAARQARDELHPVADAEHRDAQVEDAGIGGRRTVIEYRTRPARENDALGVERRDEREVASFARRMDLAVDARFPDAARDQLRELRAVVENEDAVHALYQVVGSAVSPRMRSSSVSRWRAT